MKILEIILETVRRSCDALKYIKGDILTTEILLEVVKNDGLVLEFIKDEMETPLIIGLLKDLWTMVCG